jgi:hypothetical protein
MRGMKTYGLERLSAVRSRARKQLARGAITRPDADYIVDTIDKLEAYIIKMNEKGEEL